MQECKPPWQPFVTSLHLAVQMFSAAYWRNNKKAIALWKTCALFQYFKCLQMYVLNWHLQLAMENENSRCCCSCVFLFSQSNLGPWQMRTGVTNRYNFISSQCCYVSVTAHENSLTRCKLCQNEVQADLY